MGKAKDSGKWTLKDRLKFASEKPGSKNFGKSRADWKASKERQRGKGGK